MIKIIHTLLTEDKMIMKYENLFKCAVKNEQFFFWQIQFVFYYI